MPKKVDAVTWVSTRSTCSPSPRHESGRSRPAGSLQGVDSIEHRDATTAAELVEAAQSPARSLTFRQAVEDCIEVWERRHGFEVQLDVSEDVLPPDVAGALFRITQEAITNVGKHAGATTVTIRAQRPPGQVVLEIEDDGRGFGNVDPLGPAEPGHIGLESMRERAEMLAGRLEVQGRDRGACIRVTIPL